MQYGRKVIILLLEISQTLMKKLFATIAAIMAVSGLVISCNSDDYETGEAMSYGVAVHGFKLTSDDDILANLDSVFFSIDLTQAHIYNADSLPYGTDTRRLVPSITMYDNVSKMQLIVSTATGDTIHDYLKNPEDSIDFSLGPVTLRVASFDGMVERDYKIDINVHQIKSDSLVWNKQARRPLPGTLSAPTEQKTTADASYVYCLTRAGNFYSLSYTANPYGNDWTEQSVSLPEGAYVSSLTANNGTLYLLADDGNANNHAIYTSTDMGATWTLQSHRASYLYGACNGKVLANIHNDDSSWNLIDPASGDLQPLPEGMPVSDTSNPALYSIPNSPEQNAVFVGGILPDGSYAKSAWGYDGLGRWARLNKTDMEWACSQMVLVPFVTFRINKAFEATSYPTLLAFGGKKNDGSLQRTLYTSPDYGMSWTVGAELMQLQEEVPTVYEAQAFVYGGMLHASRGNSDWTEIPPSLRLPSTAIIEEMPLSRATTPITEWECDFIFMFGGRTLEGTLSPFIWRATLNRLTFKPLQ